MEMSSFTDGLRVFSSHQDVMEILKSKSFTVVRGQDPPASREFLHGTIGAIDGPPHFQRRRTQSKALTNEAFQYLERTALQPMLDRTFSDLRYQGKDESGRYPADLPNLMIQLLYRLGARVTGVDEVDEVETIERFNLLIDEVAAAANSEWSAADHGEIIARGREALKELGTEFVRPSIDRRMDLVSQYEKDELEWEQLPRDIVTLMLLDGEEEWDDGLLIREVAVYLNASTRTTARITPHIVHHVDEYLETYPDRRAQLEDGHFLRRCAAEALRLHNIAPAFVRRASTTIELEGGATIGEGEVVVLDYRAANRDPVMFGSNADEFDPDRALKMKSGAFPWGMSFGGGAHMCIGRRMVTGSDFMKEGGEGEAQGTLAAILKALYSVGIEVDRRSESYLREDTYYDEYAKFPVLFGLVD